MRNFFMNAQQNFFLFLNNLSILRYIFIASFFSFISTMILIVAILVIEGNLLTVLHAGDSLPQFHKSIGEYANDFMTGVVIAPLAETFVFHFVLILALKRVLQNIYIIASISSIFFALAHYSNDLVALTLPFLSGMLFTFTFLYWYKKTGLKKKGFEATMGVHAGHNLYFFLISLLPF